ncbi:MAG: SRPBCC domain-containing protein [Actinomycetota bacterium]
MPRRYAVERTIAAPSEIVWRLLTDAGSYLDWNDAVVSITGPIAEGRDIELVSIADPKRTFTLHVEEIIEPARMVWTDGMPLGLFRGTRTYEVSADGESTRFSMVEEFTGPLAGLITRMIPDLTESFALFADGLQSAAEAQSSA